MTYLSDHFDSVEFECPCCGINYTIDDLEYIVSALEKMRKDIGFPIIITSGRRCPDHNYSVGGVCNSQHLIGVAVDITSNVTPSSLAILAYHYGFRYIGIGSDFVHLDMRNFGKGYSFSCIWHY